MSNPYNAPQCVYEALPKIPEKLAVSVLVLGPGRVQWNGGKHPKQPQGAAAAKQWAMWNLDGRNARVEEIIAAAGEAGN